MEPHLEKKAGSAPVTNKNILSLLERSSGQEVTSETTPPTNHSTPEPATCSPLVPRKQSPAHGPGGELGQKVPEGAKKGPICPHPPGPSDSPSLTESSWGATLFSSPLSFGASPAMGPSSVCALLLQLPLDLAAACQHQCSVPQGWATSGPSPSIPLWQTLLQTQDLR